MVNIDSLIYKIQTLCEKKIYDEDELKNKNKFISVVNEISFTTLNDGDLNEDNNSEERTNVINLIRNNQFDVNQYEDFMESVFLGKRSQYLTPYNLEQFKGMKTFKLKGYNIGYAIKPDGDIVSVFNNSNIKGIGKELIQSAIKNGGTKLDHYDGFLSSLYEPLGFKEYSRYKWDDKYAPGNWDYEKDGRPDVVMRKLDKND